MMLHQQRNLVLATSRFTLTLVFLYKVGLYHSWDSFTGVRYTQLITGNVRQKEAFVMQMSFLAKVNFAVTFEWK